MMAKFVDRPIDMVAERLFVCRTCGWFRDLSLNPAVRAAHLTTPYGRMSHERYARMDVVAHDCLRHNEAMRSLAMIRGIRFWKEGQHV